MQIEELIYLKNPYEAICFQTFDANTIF